MGDPYLLTWALSSWYYCLFKSFELNELGLICSWKADPTQRMKLYVTELSQVTAQKGTSSMSQASRWTQWDGLNLLLCLRRTYAATCEQILYICTTNGFGTQQITDQSFPQLTVLNFHVVRLQQNHMNCWKVFFVGILLAILKCTERKNILLIVASFFWSLKIHLFADYCIFCQQVTENPKNSIKNILFPCFSCAQLF